MSVPYKKNPPMGFQDGSRPYNKGDALTPSRRSGDVCGNYGSMVLELMQAELQKDVVCPQQPMPACRCIIISTF